jgi:tetratricopeptide (TPR) repeat protein
MQAPPVTSGWRFLLRTGRLVESGRMNSKVIAAAIIAGLAGLAGGFVLANSLNRSTINALKASLDQRSAPAANSQARPGELSMAPEEIRARIAEADANPGDIAFQKSLGRALYRFGTINRDSDLIAESKRLLERALKSNPDDYDVLVDLGNANFDIGYFRKDSNSIEESRRIYLEALKIKPEDADVQTDIALTWFVAEPPDLKRASAELEKALRLNPKQERALQFLTATHIRNSDFDAASKSLERLRAANSANTAIASLARQIENKTYEPIQ